MTNVSNNAERLAEIQAQLPYGAQAEIARELGVTRTAVNQTLAGKRKAPAIQQAIFRYFLDWSAKQPPIQPVELSDVDRALAARRPESATE